METNLTKKKLFEEIIEKYNVDVISGNHKEGIDEYLAKVGDYYNKEYLKSQVSVIKKEEKEDLIIFNFDKSFGYFFDTTLSTEVENLKINEILKLPLDEMEKHLFSLVMNYVYNENRKATSGNIVTNPMNIFGSAMFKGFIQERLDESLFKGHRYTSIEILNFYYYSSIGYKKMLNYIMKYFFIMLLEEKNINVKNVTIEIESYANNEYLLKSLYKEKEKTLDVKIMFKDGYYQYWNDNDERYVDEFNIDLIIPDYKEYFC